MRTFAIVCMVLLQRLQAQTPVDRAVEDVTAVIVHDVFSAPAAARLYAYTCLAGQEAMRLCGQTDTVLCESITAMPCVAIPDNLIIREPAIAAAYAMYLTARTFLYSEDMLMERCRTAMGNAYAEGSPEYRLGQQVAEAVAGWSKSDGYAYTRTLPRYSPSGTPGSWEPTPPEYADGLEPYWGTLRRFVTGSNTMHKLPPLPVFDTAVQQFWYAEAEAVRERSYSFTEEDRQIVQFWDDNPFTLMQQGHLQYGIKKVSPAGHWLNITRAALDSVSASAQERAYVYALVSMAMADAFMAAWEAKYAYSVLRPETYINRYIDDTWRPLIPSPPFPEYPSGHACVSAAAATILTYHFGENFNFTDASETTYGLPARSFSSFQSAAHEAGMSRFLAGIHYRSSITVAATYGNRLANHMIGLIKH